MSSSTQEAEWGVTGAKSMLGLRSFVGKALGPSPYFLSECYNFVSIRVTAKLLGQIPQDSWHKPLLGLSVSTFRSPTP